MVAANQRRALGIQGSYAVEAVSPQEEKAGSTEPGVGTITPVEAASYLKRDGSRSLTGNLPVSAGVTIDGVDISVHAANVNAHHSQSHKDRHDPNNGADPLDCAAASGIAGVQAAAEGSAHSFARSDHVHSIAHSIANNALVTIDSGDVVSGRYAQFTANGLDGRTVAEVLSDIGAAASDHIHDGRYYTEAEIDALAAAIQTALDLRCLESIFGASISTGLLLDATALKVSAILQKYHGIDPSANVQSLLGAVNYAAMMALLSGTATATFDLNDQQLSNIKSLAFNDGGATCTQVKDEDTMASNSATMLATQQSIKAYADTYKANKTSGGWSKNVGSGGHYEDWATMIDAMPDLIAHGVTVTIKTGTTLTEQCDLRNKHGLTSIGAITVQAEKYFPTSGDIPTADSATATTLRDAALATAALGNDYFNGCWVFIVDVGTSAITGVTVGGAGAGEFEVAGDLTARYLAADTLIVKGSTNNDGYYTVSAGGSTHAGGTTTIPVDEAVAAVADGTIQTQGVLENGFVPITDYIDATGDVVVASWPAAQPMVGDRYIIVGALIDGENSRPYAVTFYYNSVPVTFKGIGMKDTTYYHFYSISNLSYTNLYYCGFYNSGYSGIYTGSINVGLWYCGIVGNNTNDSANHAGVVSTGGGLGVNYCGISDNNKKGVLLNNLGFALVRRCFGDGNGIWGSYAQHSAQARIIAPECSGSSGNHSDEGTADTAGDDQAAAYI